jgi:hypothetical protein
MVGIASSFAAKASDVNTLDDNVRWGGQDMPYYPSRDRRRAEGGEGGIDDGVDDEHVDGRVRGPRLADTGNERRWRLRREGDNGDGVEEGRSHPTTLQTTAMRELVGGCVPPAMTGSRQRRERVTLTTAATTNTLTGVSGVRIGQIPGMGDGGDRGATVTTMTTSRRADRISPR